MDNDTASVEKNNIKLIEYLNVDNKLFLQCGCVGFYVTTEELKDLQTVINYYLAIEENAQVKILVGGEHVAV